MSGNRGDARRMHIESNSMRNDHHRSRSHASDSRSTRRHNQDRASDSNKHRVCDFSSQDREGRRRDVNDNNRSETRDFHNSNRTETSFHGVVKTEDMNGAEREAREARRSPCYEAVSDDWRIDSDVSMERESRDKNENFGYYERAEYSGRMPNPEMDSRNIRNIPISLNTPSYSAYKSDVSALNQGVSAVLNRFSGINSMQQNDNAPNPVFESQANVPQASTSLGLGYQLTAAQVARAKELLEELLITLSPQPDQYPAVNAPSLSDPSSVSWRQNISSSYNDIQGSMMRSEHIAQMRSEMFSSDRQWEDARNMSDMANGSVLHTEESVPQRDVVLVDNRRIGSRKHEEETNVMREDLDNRKSSANRVSADHSHRHRSRWDSSTENRKRISESSSVRPSSRRERRSDEHHNRMSSRGHEERDRSNVRSYLRRPPSPPSRRLHSQTTRNYPIHR